MSSFYALITTLISFIFLVIYYSISKPDYLIINQIGEEKEVSLRLLIIYSLLFSSGLGLFVFICNSGYTYYMNENEKNIFSA